MSLFSWKPIQSQAVAKMLSFSDKQGEQELARVRDRMQSAGLSVIGQNDQPREGVFGPMTEVDPFTFLANINRNISDEKRIASWEFLKSEWGLTATIPAAFEGIPMVNCQNAWFFPYKFERKPGTIALLWMLARQGATARALQLDASLFDECLAIKQVGMAKLTSGLFWVNPDEYLSTDKHTRQFASNAGIKVDPKDFPSYCKWLDEIRARLGSDFAQISHDAYLATLNAKGSKPPVGRGVGHWWLNANPRMWDLAALKVGGRQSYTARNEKGNCRRHSKSFQTASVGDPVVGFVTGGQSAITNLLKVSQPLHPYCRRPAGDRVRVHRML